MSMLPSALVLSLPVCLSPLASAAPALRAPDEGMWLFNNPPRKQLKDQLRLRRPPTSGSTTSRSRRVRFNTGGSGSFVSADGLVMTNHHVGADALQKLSTPEKNYLRDGFYAKTPRRGAEVRSTSSSTS